MKKKMTKPKPKPKLKPKRKQKIDVVLESLLNLETVVKELIKKIETLQHSQSYNPQYLPKDNNEPLKKYWPNIEPPFKYNMK